MMFPDNTLYFTIVVVFASPLIVFSYLFSLGFLILLDLFPLGWIKACYSEPNAMIYKEYQEF